MELNQTKIEQQREQRNSEILEMYGKLISEYPSAKPWRILRTIGEKYGISPEQVRLILISKGAYVVNKNVEPVEQD